MLPVSLAMGLGSLNAALIMDSRRTELQATTQFGYVGSVNLGTATLDRTSLTLDLQTRLAGSDRGEGSVGDTSWVATYEFSLDQSIEFLPAGGFTASGSVSLFAFAGDQGVAGVDATSGNRLELGFTVTAPEAYRFSGITMDLTSVVLERSVGVGFWAPVAEPGVGTFDYALDLSPGQYRLSAIGGGYHNSSQGESSAWTVQLTTVPEPPSMVVVGSTLILGAVLWRRRFPGSGRTE
jgi:hypothetical protein